MASATVLTRNDLAVLGALFDPETSLNNGTTTSTSTDTTTPAVSIADSDEIPQHFKAAEESAVASLNGSNTTEDTSSIPSESTIRSAITTLTDITIQYPQYASAYTNRAQATRLLPSALTDPKSVQSIFADLASAILLATPSTPFIPVSPAHARVLASAHTHRGYLLLRASSDSSFRALVSTLDLRTTLGLNINTNSIATAATIMKDLSPSILEEAASRDFAIAGRHGNKSAQTLAVKTNPYAKLCGQIVREALQREIKEFYEGVA